MVTNWSWFDANALPGITASAETQFMQLGAAPIEETAFIRCNFVFSNTDHMDAEREYRRSSGFEIVPDDKKKVIALTEL
ncbi:MAG: hypothetical protein CMM16_05705 [Rhodospirillaceae bacterium]|nr:hypothetical protein [Rhodospirillaceae bacterium]